MYNSDEFGTYSSDYMIWSIVNVILFFPHIYITLPNLFFSWLTRKYNERLDFKSSKYYSKCSLALNIMIDTLLVFEIIVVVTILGVFLRINTSATKSSYI